MDEERADCVYYLIEPCIACALQVRQLYLTRIFDTFEHIASICHRQCVIGVLFYSSFVAL